MAAITWSPQEATVLVSICSDELRRQFCDFLTGTGYRCIGAHSPEGLHCTDASLVVAEVEVQDAPVLARRALAARPDLTLLFVCAEPAYVGEALLPDPRVTFIEKPFAWGDLRRALLDLLTPRNAHREVPAAASRT